jgi:hypothetical protein
MMQSNAMATLRVICVTTLFPLVWITLAMINGSERHGVSQLVDVPARPLPAKRKLVADHAAAIHDSVLSALLLNSSSSSLPKEPASNRKEGPFLQSSSPKEVLGHNPSSSPAAVPSERSGNVLVASSRAREEGFREQIGVPRPGVSIGFSKADLLGGPLTLASSREVVMPVLARAQRAHWASSGDPLAPLPAEWRTPMRQAVNQLVSTSKQKLTELTAQVVHLPSTRVTLIEQVPVVIHHDGTATLLRAPHSRAAIKDIEDWAAQQPVPNQGALSIALVTIHPLLQSLPSPPKAVNSRIDSRLPAPVSATQASSVRPLQGTSFPIPPPLPTEGQRLAK